MTEADLTPTTAAAGPQLLPPEDVARQLSISREHVFKLMRSGELPFIRVGRFYRVAGEDLARFITERRRTVGATMPVRIKLRAH